MKIAATLLFLLFAFASVAQFNLIPYAGISSSQMRVNEELENGGYFPMAGVEIEWRMRPSANRPRFLSFATGLSHRTEDFNYAYTLSQTFSDSENNYYSRETLEIQRTYWQIPFMIKIHIQPFPLLEEYYIFSGVGINNNFRVKASISEEYIHISPTHNDAVFINTGPVTEHFAYRQDATELGSSYNLFGRFEFGMQYNRLHFSFRLSRSLTNTYFEGLESVPTLLMETNGLPNWAYSRYINSYRTNRMKMKEVYREVVVGFRILK